MAVNGNDVGIYVEGSLIGCLTNATFSSSNEEIDVTCKDNDGARAILPGGQTAEITFEGYFDPAASYGFQDLVAINKNRTKVWVKMSYDGTDSLTITGYAYLNQIEWTGPLNAGSTFSGTFTIDGGWNYSIT
jgi:predicted secreted protein